MADLSRKTASIYIDRSAAEEALKKLQAQADKLSDSIKKGTESGKDMVTQIKKLNTVKDEMAKVQRQIDAGLKPSFNQLAALVSKTRNELKKMSESDPKFKERTKELQQYRAELERMNTSINGVQAGQSKLGQLKSLIAPGLLAGGAAAAGLAITNFFKGAAEAALEADKIAGQFMGTLQNLGKADAFDRLTAKANEMAKQFKFIDDADVLNVFDKMLTYGKLTEAQMNALLPVIIDFSVKSKTSLDQAATTIIKALDGTGRELKQYGAEVSASKTLSENFAVVMNDLGKNVAGAAEAFGETTQGQIASTRQEIEKLKEDIGTDSLPLIRAFYSVVSDVVSGIKSMYQATKDLFRSTDDLILDLQKKGEQRQKDFAEKIAEGMGTKSIEEQKKLAESYKAIYIASQKELSNFLKSSDKNDIKRRDELLRRQDEDQQVYLSTQRTLEESIKKEKENALKAQMEEQKKADEKNARDAEKNRQRREADMKRAMEETKKLQAEWQALQARLFDTSILLENDPYTREFKKIQDQSEADLQQTKKLLDRKIINQQQYADATVKIEEQRLIRMQELVKKYKITAGDSDYTPGYVKSQTSPEAGKLADNSAKFQNILVDREKTMQNSIALFQLKSMQSTGKAKLQAQLNQLELEKEQELKNKELTENQKLIIEEQYRQKRAQAETDFNMAWVNLVMDAAQQLNGIFNSIASLAAQDDQQRLLDIQKNYDLDKSKLEASLRQKLVSQKEYDRQMRALDDKKRKEEGAIKRKEFERNKRAQIIQAIMSGAQAIVSTLAARPGPTDIISLGAFRAINIALATATTAAQVATIAAQKPPQYAKGGLLHGPSHAQGGIPIVRKGRIFAEGEGGEAMLSKETTKNNWEIVSELLHASMYGGGRRIVPYLQKRTTGPALSYTQIVAAQQRVRQFATGGILPGTTSETTNNYLENTAELQNIISELSSALRDFKTTPVRAYTLLSDINATQETMDRIKAETTIFSPKSNRA